MTLNDNIKLISFLTSIIFSASGLIVSSIKLFIDDDNTSQALYISLFSSLITLWLPSPSQFLKPKKNKLIELPSVNTSPSSSTYNF